MENNIQSQQDNNPKPKIYDPGWYGFLIFLALIGALIYSGAVFFCLIPVFIMSLHNAKIIPNGETIGKRMKTYLWFYIGYFLVTIGLFGWVYLTMVTWLMKQPEFITGALMGGDNLFFNRLKPAFDAVSAEGGALGLAIIVSQYSSYILWIPILILILLVYGYTRKNELPIFKELRASQQVDRKSPIPPILLSVAISIAFVAGLMFSVNPITKFFLKSSLKPGTNTEVSKKTPRLPSVPTKTDETQVGLNGLATQSSPTTPMSAEDIKRAQIKVAHPEYQIIGAFTEGLFIITDKDKNWFYVDENGNRINEKNYKSIYLFHEGKAAVIDFDGNAYHIYKDGSRVYPESYYKIEEFSNGYAVAMSDPTTYFHIDSNGKRIYSENYEDADSFHEGFAAVKTKVSPTETPNWNYIDTNGKKLCDGQFMWADEFVEGRAAVQKIEDGKIVAYHIDDKCNPVYPERYGYVEAYDKVAPGLAVVGYNNVGESLIDLNGKRLFDKYFKTINNCTLTSFRVIDSQDNCYFIGINGERLFQENYKFLNPCDKNGITMAKTSDGSFIFIDQAGKQVPESSYIKP
jgi:hypothetical protein